MEEEGAAEEGISAEEEEGGGGGDDVVAVVVVMLRSAAGELGCASQLWRPCEVRTAGITSPHREKRQEENGKSLGEISQSFISTLPKAAVGDSKHEFHFKMRRNLAATFFFSSANLGHVD